MCRGLGQKRLFWRQRNNLVTPAFIEMLTTETFLPKLSQLINKMFNSLRGKDFITEK